MSGINTSVGVTSAKLSNEVIAEYENHECGSVLNNLSQVISYVTSGSSCFSVFSILLIFVYNSGGNSKINIGLCVGALIGTIVFFALYAKESNDLKKCNELATKNNFSMTSYPYQKDDLNVKKI